MNTKLGFAVTVGLLAVVGGSAHAGEVSDGASCAAMVDPFAGISAITHRLVEAPFEAVVRVADVTPVFAIACESRISSIAPSVDASASCACIQGALAGEKPSTVAHWITDDAIASGDPSYAAFVADVGSRCMIAKSAAPHHDSWLSHALSDAESAFAGAVHAIEAAPGAVAHATGDAIRSLLVSDGGPFVRASIDFAFDQGIGESLCRKDLSAAACSCARENLAGVPDSTLATWALEHDATKIEADPQFVAYEHRVELCAQ